MVSGVLLAAGESKRMGRNKLLLPWGKETFFERCLLVLLRSDLDEVVIVLNPRSTEIQRRVEGLSRTFGRKLKVVLNHRVSQGMSSSIRAGIREVHPESEGVLIALGDQPLLRTVTVNGLIHKLQGDRDRIVVPIHGGRRGNPVLIGCTYFKELMEIRGDSGGRMILDRHPDQVIPFHTKSRAVLIDIDTWEEYTRFKKFRG